MNEEKTAEQALSESQELEEMPKEFPKRRKWADGDYPTKASAAVALKIAGADYGAIAHELNYANASAARGAVERVLAETVKDTGGLEHLRGLTSKRLERLLQSTWKKATDSKDPDHLAYVRTSLAIIDRHSRLMGLDAPQQMVVHRPQEKEVEQWVLGMLNQVGSDAIPEEAEIIDAEIEESSPDDN